MDALHQLKVPASPYDIEQHLTDQGSTVHPVTIYRITDQFEKLGILHRLPGCGRLSLCKQPESEGAHGYLRCKMCHQVTEFQNENLQRLTSEIATDHRYQSPTPLIEIIGLCPSCVAPKATQSTDDS